MEFQGVVKPRRRGGWVARGVVVEQRSGQRFETQVGPREFPDKPAGVAWLIAEAGRLGIGEPAIAMLAGSAR